MVGSLGTVAAPADFDFRLRARLANDSSSAVFHLKAASWRFARRGLAVAAVLIVYRDWCGVDSERRESTRAKLHS